MSLLDASSIGMHFAGAAELNTRLFRNCLVGVSNEHASRRPTEMVNSLGFVACHVLEARHFLAAYLELDHANPLEWVLSNAQSIADVPNLPRMEEVLAAWSAVSVPVEGCLRSLTARELATPSPRPLPISDGSRGGAIEFLLLHESYHIGQLAYLRKMYGYPAMQYR